MKVLLSAVLFTIAVAPSAFAQERLPVSTVSEITPAPIQPMGRGECEWILGIWLCERPSR